MWRVDDAITKYHPDMIYFDEHAGDSQVDLGVHMGLGFLAPPLVANYYNKSLQWNHGKMDVVINLKGVGGRYNSFQNNAELVPVVERALVKSTEAIIESQISGLSVPDRNQHRRLALPTGRAYTDARHWSPLLMQNVSRNGTHAAQPHPARPRRSGSASDSDRQGHRRVAEGQRRGGLCLAPV